MPTELTLGLFLPHSSYMQGYTLSGQHRTEHFKGFYLLTGPRCSILSPICMTRFIVHDLWNTFHSRCIRNYITRLSYSLRVNITRHQQNKANKMYEGKRWKADSTVHGRDDLRDRFRLGNWVCRLADKRKHFELRCSHGEYTGLNIVCQTW